MSRSAGLGQPVQGVPTCSSGPGGRITFVVREFAAVVRRQRARRQAAGEVARHSGATTTPGKDAPQ